MEFKSKWGAVLGSGSKRDVVLRGIMAVIKAEAKYKGFSGTPHQISTMIRAAGVNVSTSYVYSQLQPNNAYPFPLEAILIACEGYGIPLEKIFSAEVLAGIEGK